MNLLRLPALDGLAVNRAERALRRAYEDGTLLDLGGEASIRAQVLAAVVLSGPAARPGRTARVNLAGARITGRLDLTGARVDAPVRLRDCVFEEPIVLDHADVGSLNLDGSSLPGVEAESVQVARWLGMRNATVTGRTWLAHAGIGGAVDLDGTRFGGLVNLERAVIGGDARLGHGAEFHAGLHLRGARVGGDCNLAEARVRPGDRGAAVKGGGLTVGGGLWAHALVADGSVNLVGVRVTGPITFDGSDLRNPDGDALLLIEAQASKLTIRPTLGSAGAISLRDAHVGRLIDNPVAWPAGCRIELAGLTYDRVTRRSDDAVEWTAAQRLAWMARFTTGFAPGPYDELAAALRRDGREQEARQVLRVRERLRHRAMGRLGAFWGAVQDTAIGFGYRPARALCWLLAVLVGGTAWFAFAGPLRAVKRGEAPTWDPLLYSLDLLVPLVDLGHEKAWDPVGADKAVALLIMAAGWILATTVVAGAGRALRR